MADNIILNLGSGGDTTRALDRTGIKTQIIGLDLDVGAGTEKLLTSGQKTKANSIPIVIASDQDALSILGTYTEGDVDATITGIAMLAEDGGNTLKPLQVDAAGHLIVHQGTENIALPDAVGNTRFIVTDDGGNPTPSVTFGYLFNGTTWDRMRGTAADGVLVNLGANNDVTVTGTVVVSSTDLDIRNLVFATDKVDISGSTLNITQLGGTAIDTNAGTKSAGTLRVVKNTSSTATVSTVPDAATSGTILAANANRVGATIYNDSSALLYLLLGSGTATSANYSVRIYSNGYYEVPQQYVGQINGIWASDPNDGAARVTELT